MKINFLIITDIDNIRVGFASIKDYEEKNDKPYIKVYTSVFFYDDVSNNNNSENNISNESNNNIALEPDNNNDEYAQNIEKNFNIINDDDG